VLAIRLLPAVFLGVFPLILPAAGLRMQRIASYESGHNGGAEIVAVLPGEPTGPLAVVNGAEQGVQLLDAKSMKPLEKLDVSKFGDPTSVAIVRRAENLVLAVAVVARPKTDPGHVVLFSAASEDTKFSAQPIAVLEVGANPDMIKATEEPLGFVVANEGEPSADYATDPPGSVSFIAWQNDHPLAETVGFESLNDQRAELVAEGVRVAPVAKTLAADLEPEYVAISPTAGTVFVTLQENNALAVIDRDRKVKLVPLGAVDYSLPGAGLDVSDKDGIRIANYPVHGLRQPDSIVCYAAGGAEYLITANEGEHREYDGLTDSARAKDLKIDPALRSALQKKHLSRLRLSAQDGDQDHDGDLDQLYSFGSRGISIFTTAGDLVYDSGDAIEQAVAERFPERFNHDGDGGVDTRSDDKGPEPEGLALAMLGDQQFVFVGLERPSSIAVFDVTTPTETKLVGLESLGKDVAPEGLCYWPTGLNAGYLAVACEVSGSVVLWRVDLSEPNSNK
jgi:hypothetical protein